MDDIFEDNESDRCCLCGSGEALTGEHKSKASVIRSIFPDETMAMGSFRPGSRPFFAQSSTSKIFHFKPRLCGSCNSRRTQPFDVEFAHFDETVRELVARGERPTAVFATPRYVGGRGPFVDALRYFAKILACHIAESGGPRFLALTEFALGESDFNPIELTIDTDPAFQRWSEVTGDGEFAGHGGLAVSFSRVTGVADGIRSSLTHGRVRYWFSVGLQPALARELKIRAPDFYAKGEVIFRKVLERELASSD